MSASGAYAAPAPRLVADWAPGLGPSSLKAENLGAAGEALYFSGRDEAHGEEPWTSDGTAAGTVRLADLCPGPCPSRPSGFEQLGAAVVFYTLDGRGAAIYRLEPGADDDPVEIFRGESPIVGWQRLGSLIYFATADDRLYRSDGSRDGTWMIRQLQNALLQYLTQPLAAIGGAIYFADQGQLLRLTENGEPQPFYTLGEDASSSASGFTALDARRFVFTACPDRYAYCSAHVSDGTAAGTFSLENPENPWLTADPQSYTAWRGRIYFVSYYGTPGFRLVSTDGTVAGTRHELGADNGSVPQLLGANSSHLFFSLAGSLYAQDGGGGLRALLTGSNAYHSPLGRLGEQLIFAFTDHDSFPSRFRILATSGEPDGTVELTEGVAAATPGAVFQGHLYFAKSETLSGPIALWRTGGSAASTSQVADGGEQPRSSLPRPFRVGAGLAADAADGAAEQERHLYSIDPATLASQRAAEQPLAVLAAGRNRLWLAESLAYGASLTGAYDGARFTSLPVAGHSGQGAVSGDDVFFFFTDAAPGQKLWQSDGTALGTRQLIDFPQSSECGEGLCHHRGYAVASGEQVFFFAQENLVAGQPQLAVWDRAAGEQRNLHQPVALYPALFAVPGGRAIFDDVGADFRRQWWVSDGSEAGTFPFFTLPEELQTTSYAIAGGRFYQALWKLGEPGQSLWSSDLTADGNHLVLDLPRARFGRMMAAGGDSHDFYFVADVGHGQELGVSDGSAAGTRFFDLRPGPEGSAPEPLLALDDGRLLFAAAADEAGYELWISDGTRLGTYRLTDLYPGPAASSPSDLAQVGGRLFFQATDGSAGRELWALDLPAAGPAPCPAGRVCLLGNRFEVELVAHAPDGEFPGRKEIGNDSSAVYSFFSPGNWEMLLKALDGCAINGHRWVYAAAATDVGWTLRITDRETGLERVYENPAGQASRAVTDAGAFPCASSLAATPAAASLSLAGAR